ncbi:hypothetical protein ACFE33_11165 [Falsihalocynthiibacter sp. SS001]|uniref:hypothetical protein n=1 Tax=Falsihalocynthiibacter sp. SS001 TaxID=3349698 RepID=UPI0036D386E4
MYKKFLFCAALTLSACGGGEAPFGTTTGPGSDGEDGVSTDPKEIYTAEMNNLVYDAKNDELIINNLPFDGVDGRYENTGIKTVEGFEVFASKKSGEQGKAQYYAIYASSENGRAGAAGTAFYAEYGHGGAMIGRNTTNVNLPVKKGELVYRGDYAGIIVGDSKSGRSEVSLASGDAVIFVDLLDFDVDGAVLGGIRNREEFDVEGNSLGSLSNIILNETSISEDGRINSGTANTFQGSDIKASGSYEGVFAGRNGEQIVGTVKIEGAVDNEDSELGRVQETGVFIVTD